MAKPKKSKKPLAKKTTKAKAKPKPAKRPAAKKPVAKKPVAKKPVAKKPVAKKPAAAQAAASDWRADLRAAVTAAGPDFTVHGGGASAWEFADTPELAGLEAWGTALAKRDRRAGIGALVRAAQYGMPIVLERGGVGLDGMNFRADEPSMDGAPVEKQIQLAAAWLDAPDAKSLAAVDAGCDPSRQLQIWDDDLRPAEDAAHWWYSEVGQCCGYAITRKGGTPSAGTYYGWPPETCVGRGLVIAVRGLRTRGDNDRAIIDRLRAALVG